MDNRKKNIHSSGPLGMLIKSGKIKHIENDDIVIESQVGTKSSSEPKKHFKTDSGIAFNQDELFYVDPKACEPWKYANRLNENMGNMEELVASIRDNKQLQPALVRPHPEPHGKVEYEIIFGRRRYLACLQLEIPLLVIKKNINTIHECLIFQEAENRVRKDISNYSSAVLYKRLIEDRIYKNERELSEGLGIPLSSLYDILAYSKIPHEVIENLTDIHTLSNSLAIKIVSLIKQFPEKLHKMIVLAVDIGKTINSPLTLERKFLIEENDKRMRILEKPKIYHSKVGAKLFTLKTNHRGVLCLEINKAIQPFIDHEKLCEHLKGYLEFQQENGERSIK